MLLNCFQWIRRTRDACSGKYHHCKTHHFSKLTGIDLLEHTCLLQTGISLCICMYLLQTEGIKFALAECMQVKAWFLRMFYVKRGRSTNNFQTYFCFRAFSTHERATNFSLLLSRKPHSISLPIHDIIKHLFVEFTFYMYTYKNLPHEQGYTSSTFQNLMPALFVEWDSPSDM